MKKRKNNGYASKGREIKYSPEYEDWKRAAMREGRAHKQHDTWNHKHGCAYDPECGRFRSARGWQ